MRVSLRSLGDGRRPQHRRGAKAAAAIGSRPASPTTSVDTVVGRIEHKLPIARLTDPSRSRTAWSSSTSPRAWTSHDVVAKLRKVYGQRRVGHAGTLDPDATGVLLVGLGRVTRLLRFLQDTGKGYRATVVFGVATTRSTRRARSLDRAPMPIDQGEIEAVVRGVRR